MHDDRAFELALDEALQLLASGVSREECLRRYPHYAAEFAPLLAAAESARVGLLADQPLPKPNLARGKGRFLDAVRVSTPRPGLLLNWRLVSAALALLLVVLIGTGAASANALPGEVLYPVKRGLESVLLALTFDAEARTRLQDEQAARRRAEAREILALQRTARIEFEGVVEMVEHDALQISGLRVLTEAASEFQVADRVRVLAHTSPEAVIADQIILLVRPTSTATATPTHAPTATITATSTRSLDTTTPPPTLTQQRPTETRVQPTATATPTVIRPTLITPTDTPTPPPTEVRPTETPTPLRLTDTPTAEATAPRLTPTATSTGRP